MSAVASRAFGPARTLAAATVVALLGAGTAFAQSGFEAPPYANGSVTATDDAAGLFLNPAAAGVRNGPGFVVSASRAPSPGLAVPGSTAPTLWRTGFVAGDLGLAATWPDRGRAAYALSIASGPPRWRLGASIQSRTTGVERAIAARSRGRTPAIGPGAGDDRTTDLGLGLLSRPSPWLSLGATVEHAGQPRLGAARLDRTLTLGLGVRPLALSAARAHTLGTRLTLTADVQLRRGDAPAAARVRVGGELEVVSGVLARLAVEDHGGVRFGIALRGARATASADAQDCDRCGDPAGTFTATFHAAEERTALARLEPARIAEVRIDGDLGDEDLAGVSIFGPTRARASGPIHAQLERALDDPLTRGVLLRLGGTTGMAQVEELKPRIERLRRAGKPVVAYLEYGGRRADLYLASACDRIVTTPEAFYAGLGLHGEIRYYRRLLDDWGIRVDRSSYGRFKSAYRNFSVDSTPPADREAIDRVLDVAQGLFVTAVARDRKIPESRLLTALDGRAWRSSDLRALGVVDSVGYRDDALALIGGLTGLGRTPRTVDLRRMRAARPEWLVPEGIAVVYASGGIESGRSGNDLLLGPYMGAESVARAVERAFRNPAARAVVLRIDSPGGSSAASDMIHHAVARMRRETGKPLVVSMAGAAASGGYNIAVPADFIFADRYTRTGSIGVLTLRYSLEDWFRAHRVRQDDFDRGEFMRYWSIGHDWDARAQASADSSIRSEYRDFVALVARSRRLSYEAVDAVAQGRVWMGEDARERSLVDAIGGLEEAIAEARRRAGIPAGAKIDPAEYRRPRPGWIQALAGNWVREAWERSIRLPEPGAAFHWAEVDAYPVE